MVNLRMENRQETESHLETVNHRMMNHRMMNHRMMNHRETALETNVHHLHLHRLLKILLKRKKKRKMKMGLLFSLEKKVVCLLTEA
jgi:hypothetical protein